MNAETKLALRLAGINEDDVRDAAIIDGELWVALHFKTEYITLTITRSEP